MKKNNRLVFLAALVGGGLAFVQWGVTLLGGGTALFPVEWMRQALRWLSLSGMPGNALAWFIVLAVSALPLLMLRRQKGGWENALPPISAVTLFAGLFFLVNPARLNSPLADFFPILALTTALATVVGWVVLKALNWMEGAAGEKLAEIFYRLFVLCGLLMVCSGVYATMIRYMSEIDLVRMANTGGNGMLLDWGVLLGGMGTGSLPLTLVVMTVLAIARLVPDILAGLTMVWAGELARSLGDGRFDQVDVELCRSTALSCRRAVLAQVLVSVGANLLQLLLFAQLRQSSFRTELPLFSIALAAGLFLLCRLLERGRELQEDSDSII